MDPITLAIQGAGLAVSLFGMFGHNGQVDAAKQKADAEKAIASDEMKQDQVRRQAMEFDASRKNMEVLRNVQRARALGLAGATQSGSNKGSGLQGGYGQISGYGNTNMFGIQQNLGYGEQMFDLNNMISQQKMNIADAQSHMATAQGTSAFGSDLMKGASTITGIGKDMFAGGKQAFDFFSKPGLIGF